ncbi:MAG: VCBS repeat-containing protein [Verrucomicrobiales bacterium]|nr:VCBS repeat-containing protein [Verrucomicrobiales bacterium]
MSKKVIIFILVALVLVAALVITNFGKNLPFARFRTPAYTAEIPEIRPKRLDQRLLERFEGENMADILAILAAEKAASMAKEGPKEKRPTPDQLYDSLPKGPFPFDNSATPRDKEWLTQYVTSMKRDENSKPSPSEIWRFNLALSALQISPDKLPASLKLNVAITPESDTMPVILSERESGFTPPFTIGNFDSTPDIEVIDEGGTRLNKISETGSVVPIEGHGIIFAGSRLYPADFDSDGDTDLFLIRPEGFPNSLLQNDGNGSFEDVTIGLGLLSFNDTTAATWVDYDNDGRLDLLEGSADHPLKLYHQTAGGAFQPIAWDLKLWVHRGVRELKCADVSGDGIADIFVGIDDQPDRLLIPIPAATWDEWRFENILASQGLARADDHEAKFLDFNHDGAIDLAFFGQNAGGKSFFSIAVNEGDGRFSDATEELGFIGNESVSALGLIDFDQDGFDDLYLGTPRMELNRAFWNRSGMSFREISIAIRGTFLDEPDKIFTSDLDQNGLNDLLYLTDEGKIRWLEPGGSTSSTLQISLSKPLRGGKIVTTVRDLDWILQSLTYTIENQTSLSLGIGEAEIIEKLTVLSADGNATLFEGEQLAPNDTVIIPLSDTAPRPAVGKGEAENSK